MPDNNENLNLTYEAPGIDSSGEEQETQQYIVKQHDEDVIFYKESLEEFIRLIQRQGINNLTIYSVSDLLTGDKYKTITARFPPPNWSFTTPPQEFEFDELKDRKGYFVFVRYSFGWEGDVEHNGEGPAGARGFINERNFTENSQGEYHSRNEINGRHVFVKTINDIKFYAKYKDEEKTVLDTAESSVFNKQESNENPIPDIVGDNGEYMKNGTFTVTIDNIQYVIKIKGFNDDGEYIGKVKIPDDSEEIGTDGNKLNDNSDGYVLRGDGAWANEIDNDWLPVEHNESDLGKEDQAWRDIYVSGSVIPAAENNEDKVIGYCGESELDDFAIGIPGTHYDKDNNGYDLTESEIAGLAPQPTEGKTIPIYKEDESQLIGYCSTEDLENYTPNQNGLQYDGDNNKYNLTDEQKEALSPTATEGNTIPVYKEGKEKLLGYCTEEDKENYTINDTTGMQYDEDGQHYDLTDEQKEALSSQPIEGKTELLYKREILGYCSSDELDEYAINANGAQYTSNGQHYSLVNSQLEALSLEPTEEKNIPIYNDVIAGYCTQTMFTQITPDASGEYSDSENNHYILTSVQEEELSTTPTVSKDQPIYEYEVFGYVPASALSDAQDDDGQYFDAEGIHYTFDPTAISENYVAPKQNPIYEYQIIGYVSASDLAGNEDQNGEYFDKDGTHYNLEPENISDDFIEPRDQPIYERVDTTSRLGEEDKPWDELWVKDANITNNANITGGIVGYCTPEQLTAYTKDNNGGYCDEQGNRYNLSNDEVQALKPTPQGDYQIPIYSTASLTINNKKIDTNMIPTTKSTSNFFWRGDGAWANELTGKFFVSDDTEAQRYTSSTPIYNSITANELINNGQMTTGVKTQYLYTGSSVGIKPYGNYLNQTSTYYINQQQAAQLYGNRFLSFRNVSSGSNISENSTLELLIQGTQDLNNKLVYMYESYESVTLIAEPVYNSSGEIVGYNQYFSTTANKINRIWSGIINETTYGEVNSLLRLRTKYNSSINSTQISTANVTYYKFVNTNIAKNYYVKNNNLYTVCTDKEYTDTVYYQKVGSQTNDPAVGLGLDSASVEGSIYTLGGISARKSIKGYKVYAAVFNDYAECRKTIDLPAGKVVVDNDDGSLSCASQRLQPGAQVISDTYGHLIGEMPGSKTPLAVSGRVLVYTYQPRENYHAGMAVCSAPNGTVDIMTREEIREYPDCIVGIVSEIPNYKEWGSDKVKVDNRIWIKVK